MIEDFKHPEHFKYLNDTDNKELNITEIIQKFNTKEIFSSKLLTEEDQLFLMKNIKMISTYKGTMIDQNINLSDIAFFKKI